MVVMDQADERRKERRTDGQSCLLRLCLTVFRVRIVTLLIAHLILLLPTAMSEFLIMRHYQFSSRRCVRNYLQAYFAKRECWMIRDTRPSEKQ